MAKREIMMLAHVYSDRIDPTGWYWSEKLDGMRCFWDGGLTRGVPKAEVPWANTEKDNKRYKNHKAIATGLWSRNGGVIHAPEWWLNELSKTGVTWDGELWNQDRTPGGRGRLLSTVKKFEPDDEAWKEVGLYAFDSPSLVYFYNKMMLDRIVKRLSAAGRSLPPLQDIPFEEWYEGYRDRYSSKVLRIHNQEPVQSRVHLSELRASLPAGAEGGMLRKADSTWTPERSHSLLKVKDADDGEAIITGFWTGEETDKGSRLLGRIGSLICVWKDPRDSRQEFRVAGLMDELRAFAFRKYEEHAARNPGTRFPEQTGCVSKHFSIGDIITIKYNGVTADGMPNFPRYWRHE